MSNVDTSAIATIAAQFPTWESMADYTADFLVKFKRNPSMSIEDAHALLARVAAERDSSGMTAADWCEVFENAEADTENKEQAGNAADVLGQAKADATKAAASVSSKHPIAIRAENMAAALAASKEFTKFVDDLFGKKIDVERGALDVLFHFRTIYGKKLKDFPIVGSKGGNNPDLYQGEYTKADGTKGTKEMSFYTTFAMSLPSYIAATAQRELIKLAGQKPVPANVPQEYRGKTAWFLDGKDRVFKNKQTTIKAWCVTAMTLEQNLERINSELGTKVKATLVSHKNANGKEEPAPGIVDCFMVGDYSNGDASLFAAHETLTISKFKGLDIDEAKANGGTYDALMATIKRAPKKDETATAGVGTFDQLQNAWALTLAFVETLKTKEQRDMLHNKIAADKEGFLETVFDLKDTLIDICKDVTLQKIYARHMTAKRLKEAAEADAANAADQAKAS